MRRSPAKRFLALGVSLTCMMSLSGFAADRDPELRPPAVPLVVHDPYFSIWSTTTKLADSDTVHWTGGMNALVGTVSVDGKVYRFMGKGPGPVLTQIGVAVVLPTRTLYTFTGAGIALWLRFITPALPDDLNLLSRPVTYMTAEIHSDDGKPHQVAVAFGASAQIATRSPDQRVEVKKSTVGKLSVLRVGSVDQPVLAEKGDGVRIGWGHVYLAAASDKVAAAQFVGKSGQPASAVMADLAFNPEIVEYKPVFQTAMIAYDDEYSVQYFKQNLRPYWRRNGEDANSILKKAFAEYDSLKVRCKQLDSELLTDLAKAGGDKYAKLACLAYRQCLAGCKLVADPNGQPLLFPKENTSNGCIGTSDVIYPMAPQFLLFGPSLSKAMLVPILDYAASSRWRFPFAPHDLGTYPQANGQVYGGGERTEENQMPVEESANMLILVAVVAQMEGNANFSAKYWPTLTKWADYLKAKGFDPENQLCTDDFLGHLAHNVNLSAKAMLGIASYARLCEMRGDLAQAREYGDLARSFAARWTHEADDGDHFRLTFDRKSTWSQKYNLVWDKILGFGLFPDSVRAKEMAYYRKMMNPFGAPLDNRGSGAKLDWSLWTATLTQNPEDFAAIMEPVYRFVDETPQRVGMGDWYNTANSNHIGMHSRPVVGGVFLQMLYSKSVWGKWAGRDTLKVGNWAPIPKPPVVTMLVPAADTKPATWSYTVDKPMDGWQKDGYAVGGWKQGLSGFGTHETPGVSVHTIWNTDDIWLRREVDISAAQLRSIQLWLHHDEDVEVYINGVLAFRSGGYTSQYDINPLLPEGRKALKTGKNLIAVHCHQTSGGQYIDLGFVEVKA